MHVAARLVLATDPDREGEAIAWHVTQELQARPPQSLKMIKKTLYFISPTPYAQRGAPVLATDPIREGEALAWHVRQELKARC